MPFFAIHGSHVLSKSVIPFEPWTFIPEMRVSDQIRHDKQSRQDFYRHVETKWNFYTPLEGSNPNQRISKEDNPPRAIHGLAADYDVKIPMERVKEVVAAMDIKPAWIETSLGGKVRLLWLFPRTLKIDGTDFCMFFLERALKWLRLDLLPGLDEGAFLDPTRLLCNGAVWESTGHGPISEVALQTFYVAAGREFRFVSTDPAEVPLDVVEAKIKEKFPNFSWPGEFALESQGPSFWVEGSTSSMSAIVKKDGMFTFSDHADKQFYSWGDILGTAFIKQHADNAIANATKEIYWDQKNFWRKKGGYYANVAMAELQNFFKVQCRLSSKPGKGGESQVDLALDHIYNVNSISGAGPFVFRTPGVLDYMGRPVLNTYIHRVMHPAAEPQVWGPSGNFPFLSLLLDALFDPEIQKHHFLAWWKHFYISAHTMTPMPGQNIYLMGGANIGKTFSNRALVGRSVGGFVDASEYLIGGSSFNSEMWEVPLWCVDDESIGENQQMQARFQAIWKKVAANQQFKCSKKFEIPLTIDWMGRIIATLNMDYVSSRLLGPMDNTSNDKTCVFKCAAVSRIVFPQRYDLAKIVDKELPCLLRWLLDWNPPDFVIRDVRYGYAAYHEPTLIDKAHQGSKSAPFKELLIEFLRNFFRDEKTATEWRGSATMMLRALQSDPHNESILRMLRLEQTNRYLEMIQREGLIQCKVETDEMKTRIWVFPRFGTPATPPQTIPPIQPNNIFQK